MKINQLNLLSKLRNLILIISICFAGFSCKDQSGSDWVIRFEKMAFTIPPADLPDSIYQNNKVLIPFFRIFNEEIIRIGPDSLPGYAGQLGNFIHDSLIARVYARIEKTYPGYHESFQSIGKAFKNWAGLTGGKSPDHLVTYISGFNQSFITLPGILGIGIDNYLGSDSPFYQDLGVPAYLRKHKNPEDLTADAVRAWLYTEIPEPAPDGGFLDRMIHEGRIYYITGRLLNKTSDENLFHFSKEQLKWCLSQEKAMWKYLAEQKILFSSDRLIMRKFLSEAPFTRDFGNESPGQVGVWIGYRIVSSYMKASGKNLKDLVEITSAKEILSGSKYHP